MSKKIIFFALLVFCYKSPLQAHILSLHTVGKDTSQPKKKISRIDILAVGDIMLGSNFPDKKDLPPIDGKFLLSEADSVIHKSTLSFGNLEGTFLNQGGTPKGFGDNIYNFRQPEAYAAILAKSGFDIMSIANNHINDFGSTGIESTIKTLDKAGIAFSGTPSRPYVIVERSGVKIALVSFAPHAGCMSMLDLPKAVLLVKSVKKLSDIVIVSFHGGAEGSGATHVTRKTEIFYNQNRGNVYEFAHQMIDAGADVIIGHGPHVPRALELYKSKIIAYSLGNFCTYGKFSLKGISGYAPAFYFNVSASGDFIDGQIISFLQKGEGGPIFDAAGNASNHIRQMTLADFPETSLLIDKNGAVRIKK